MKIEASWNILDGHRWYGIGVCLDKTTYHHEYKNVFRIELLVFSVYIRW